MVIVENGGEVGLTIFYLRFYIVDCEVGFRGAFLRYGLFGFLLDKWRGGGLNDYLRMTICYLGSFFEPSRMRPFDRLPSTEFGTARTERDGFGIVGCWFCWGKMRKRYPTP